MSFLIGAAAGAIGGMLLGGNKQEAQSVNDIKNTLSSTIENTMESLVKANVNVACENKQIVDGAKGCDIQFSDQICKAVGISNASTSSSFSTTLSQDVMNQITASSDTSNEGLAFLMKQSSASSNIIKNTVNMVMNSTQSFTTDCTRDVSAINEQTVKNCEASSIRFSEQVADAKVIGDCVASTAGNMTAAQQLTSTMDATATSKNKGIDIWAVVVLAAAILLILILGIPIFIFGASAVRSMAGRGMLTPEMARAMANNSAAQQQVNMRKLAAGVIFTVMLLTAIIWWPFGYFAYNLGIAPWPYPGPTKLSDGSPNPCFEGVILDKSLFVNDWMWYDSQCLAEFAKTASGEPTNNTNCDKQRAYKNCGLFAKNFGCDDPQFLADRGRYVEALDACAPLDGATFQRCTPTDIATHLFSNDEQTYAGCVRCTGNTDDEKNSNNPRANFGFWRRAPEDVNKGDTTKDIEASNTSFLDFILGLEATTPPDDWGSCVAGQIDPYAYLRQQGDAPCEASDPSCYTDENEYKRVSPGECLNPAYQQRKRMLSRYLKQCDRVQEASVYNINTEGEIPLLSKQCPPQPLDYLRKCRRSDKKCSYIAQGCECDADGENCDCSGADPRTVASCSNDIEGCCKENEDGTLSCIDDEYRADLLNYMHAQKECSTVYEQWKVFQPWGWLIPLVSYVIGIGIIVYLLISTPLLRQDLYAGYAAPQTSIFWRVGIITFLLVVIFACGFPVGVLAAAYAGSPVSIYDEEYIDGIENFNEKTALIVGWIGFVGALLCLLAYGGYIVYRWFYPKPQSPSSGVGSGGMFGPGGMFGGNTPQLFPVTVSEVSKNTRNRRK